MNAQAARRRIKRATDSLELVELPDGLIETLWEDIVQLHSLVFLVLRNARVTSVPPEIGRLQALKRLDLQNNQLTYLPTEIGNLTALKRLHLAENNLTVLPAEIGRLRALETLYLHNNQLTALPMEIGDLHALGMLHLDRNALAALPAEIGNLRALQALHLSSNNLTAVPSEIGKLLALQTLHLDGNQLTVIPREIGKLRALQVLCLHANALVELPVEIGDLQALQTLTLGSNQIAELPPEIGKLQALATLQLDNNQLADLPATIGDLQALRRFSIRNNELGIPVEVLGVRGHGEPESPARVLDYYFKLQEGTQPLHEAKLVLVGRGSVGKTSLVNRLVRDTFEAREQKTCGIEITKWPVTLLDQTEVTLNIWDFGGQEIMHATHQFFLTERSLYLVVISGREGREDADAEYWLRLVESFAGDSPVIVVLNKVKDHDFDLDRRSLRKKFPNVRGFVKTDCAGEAHDQKAPVGLPTLREEILLETQRLDGLRAQFPQSWFAIKERLAGLCETKTKYLRFEQYQAICTEYGETDEKAQEELAAHLHNLGIALNYKDDPRLRDTHVLSPHWVTEGIYKILNAQGIAQKKGELDISDLARVLDKREYPLNLHAFLIDLMRKFELCFPFLDRNDRYLIPELLGKEAPSEIDTFDPATCLNFEYHYPILPEGLLPRFIVRTHVLSRQTPRWRSGVVLKFEGSRALVTADAEKRKVVVRVDGLAAGMSRLLTVVRADFEHIHQSFKFEAEAMVPVPGQPDHCVRYAELRAHADRGNYEVPVYVGKAGFADVDVRKLLRLVDIEPTSKGQLDSNRQAGLRLFYCYAHEDGLLRDELDTHLKILSRRGVISTWHDREIPAGERWDERIDDYLEKADIILLLVSADFIASDYLWNRELKRALEREKTGVARIIPVIVRDVNWSDAPFSKLQALPSGARSVDQWENRDSAWRDVSEGIEEAAHQIAACRG